MTSPLRAIVLAGGRSSRMGGRHKPAIPVGGVAMVARAVAALRDAGAEPLVVGEAHGVPPGVPVVREHPRFSGPLAAVAAGVAELAPAPGGVVLLLGGDMPFVTPHTLRALAAAALGGSAGVAVAEDADGRAQPLCAAWTDAALRERLAALGDPADRPLRALYEGAEPIRIPIPAREAMDVDSPDDLRAAGE
jgi:molybdopterin-guanine dinucleotide biosynthesis protein A